jgi:hypothetical protein
MKGSLKKIHTNPHTHIINDYMSYIIIKLINMTTFHVNNFYTYLPHFGMGGTPYY